MCMPTPVSERARAESGEIEGLPPTLALNSLPMAAPHCAAASGDQVAATFSADGKAVVEPPGHCASPPQWYLL